MMLRQTNANHVLGSCMPCGTVACQLTSVDGINSNKNSCSTQLVPFSVNMRYQQPEYSILEHRPAASSHLSCSTSYLRKSSKDNGQIPSRPRNPYYSCPEPIESELKAAVVLVQPTVYASFLTVYSCINLLLNSSRKSINH